MNPADAPVLVLVLASSTLPLSTTNDYAEQIFMQQISQLPGVAQVTVFGAQRYAVRIDADSDLAAARGLTLNDIGNAVIAANSITPVGGLRGVTRNVTLDAPGQLLHAEDFRSIVVAWRNGAPVRVSDVGNVIDSVENDQIGAWYGKDRAIQLAIFRQPDANTVAVVDAIKDKLPLYQSQLPPSIKAYVLHDRSDSIRQSVHDVQFTLMLSIALVVLVIFLFLKSMAATLIPALALPVSLIGTCAFMYLSAIRSIIFRCSRSRWRSASSSTTRSSCWKISCAISRKDNAPSRRRSPVRGEIGFTILSITLSLVAVFIPVLLMGGVVGRRVPRIRRDDFLCDPGLGLRFADADADALRADAASDRSSRQAECFLPADRFLHRRHHDRLPGDARFRLALALGHAVRDLRHFLRQHVAVRLDSERLLPGRRYRLPLRRDRNRRGHRLPALCRASAGDRRDPHEGSGGRLCDVVGGHRADPIRAAFSSPSSRRANATAST